MSKKYKVVEVHYGAATSFWRVVALTKDSTVKTLKKFSTKTEADQYIIYLTQATDRSHNQW